MPTWRPPTINGASASDRRALGIDAGIVGLSQEALEEDSEVAQSLDAEVAVMAIKQVVSVVLALHGERMRCRGLSLHKLADLLHDVAHRQVEEHADEPVPAPREHPAREQADGRSRRLSFAPTPDPAGLAGSC